MLRDVQREPRVTGGSEDALDGRLLRSKRLGDVHHCENVEVSAVRRRQKMACAAEVEQVFRVERHALARRSQSDCEI